jgi:hypothetical protein
VTHNPCLLSRDRFHSNDHFNKSKQNFLFTHVHSNLRFHFVKNEKSVAFDNFCVNQLIRLSSPSHSKFFAHHRHGELSETLSSVAGKRVSVKRIKIENSIISCCGFSHLCCEIRSISILILGLKETGKTEIAYRLTNKKRDEFLPTKGCRTFSTKFEKQLIKFTELGGEEFYDIWKYYFLDVSKCLERTGVGVVKIRGE